MRNLLLTLCLVLLATPATLTAKSKGALTYATPESVKMDGEYLNRTIDSIANASIDSRCFPGCQILVARKGKIVLHKSYGHHTYDCEQEVQNSHLYDMASCTKVMAATICLMKLADEGKIDLDKPYSTYFEELRGTNKEDITLREYLSHQGGLRNIGSSKMLYNKERMLHEDMFSTEQSEDFPHTYCEGIYASKNNHKLMFSRIANQKVSAKKFHYSCLMFHTYPTLVERITGKKYEEFLNEEFYKPLGAKGATYNPRNKYPLSQIVPTARNSNHRKVVHGYVHDFAAASLGGVSGNAGLFANTESLAPILQMLLNGGTYNGKRYLKSKTIREWTSRHYTENGNHRAVGFDKRRLNDNLPLSERTTKPYYYAPSASEKSFGHSGFTGTMVWVDPVEDLIFIFLSNRVYPNTKNQYFKLNPRSKCHEAAYEAIRRYKKR